MTNSTTRLQWPDVAKGVCILLVVLHHVTGKQYGMVVPGGLDVAEDAWLWVTAALKPIRMPLFFAVSGFFAASSIAKPWSAVGKRIVNPYYLYVVWLVVFAGIYSVERTLPANRTDGPLDFLTELVWAATSMWFLFALAAYFALAKALRRVPAPAVLGVAAAVAAVTSWLPLYETNRVAVLAHFGYFAFGAYYPQLFRRLASLRLPLLALLPVYVALTVALDAAGAKHSVTVQVLSLVGVPMGVVAAVRLSGDALLAPAVVARPADPPGLRAAPGRAGRGRAPADRHRRRLGPGHGAADDDLPGAADRGDHAGVPGPAPAACAPWPRVPVRGAAGTPGRGAVRRP